MKKKIKGIVKGFRTISKKYFSTNVLFTTFVILSFFIGYMTRVYTMGNFFEFKAVFTDLSVILIIGSFGYLVKPQKQFIYFFIWLSVFTFLGIANSIYYQFFNSFVSVTLISSIQQVGEVDDSVTDKLSIFNFVYLIAPIIMIYVHKKLVKKNYYFEIRKTEKGKRMFIKTMVAGFLTVAAVIVTLSSMELSRFVKQWNREYIVQRMGLYMYTVNDVVQSVKPKINTLFGYDESARKFREFYNKKEKTSDNNKYTDIFKGKNVIFIHGESIQTFLINNKFNGKEVTPNLNKLAKEGLYFSNFYPQISVGTSSDTEFTLSTGLMPSNSGTVFVSYFDREYESIQKYFNKKGYYTFSMHGNKADFWNRKVMHENLGYKDFFAQDTYEIDDIVGLGLSDKSFFRQITPRLKEVNEKKTPFFSTVITLSNHSPFNDLEKYLPYDVSMSYKTKDESGKDTTAKANYLENTEMGNYLKSSHYADAALGEFFKSLNDSRVLDDTVIVFYGDHEARLSKQQFDRMYNYDPETDDIKPETDPTYVSMDNYKYDMLKNTPFIIWSKDNKFNKEITDVMGMYDVLPTIGNMFGFETPFALGHDIFSKNEKVVIFPNGNFITNKVYYNNLKDEYILRTNDPIDSEYIKRLKKYTEQRLELSNDIIVHDLIKNEKNNVEVKK